MLGLLCRRNLRTAPHVGHTSVMGTVACQQVYGLNGAAAAEKALQELHRLDALWSPYRSGNIIDAVRKTAGSSAGSVVYSCIIA